MARVEYTAFAMRAFNLAEVFKVRFPDPVGGAVAYRAEIATPEGDSTAGGRQPVQHIKLVPVDSGVTIVAGSANMVDNVAELRSFGYLAAVHAQRFKGARIPLDEAAYRALHARMEQFFKDLEFRVTTLETPPAPAVAPPVVVSTGTSGIGTAIGALFALLLLLGAALYYVLALRRPG